MNSSRDLEDQASEFLREHGEEIRPSNRSIKADYLTYLDAVAGYDPRDTGEFDAFDSENGPRTRADLLRSVSLLMAISKLSDEKQDVLVNHTVAQHTFRDMVDVLKSGGKSRYHLLFHNASTDVRAMVDRIIVQLSSRSSEELERLEKEMFEKLLERLVLE